MYQYFIQDAPYTAGIPAYPRFDYVKTLYVTELERVNTFIRNSNIFVQNTHILVRLMGTLDALYCADIKQYMFKVYDQLAGLERMFGFSSATNNNITAHSGILYCKGVFDVFLSVTDFFDYYNAKPDDLDPLYAISHPFSMLNCFIPDGKVRTRDMSLNAISVTVIDIGKVAYIYHHWRNKQTDGKIDLTKSITQFVYKKFLAKMIPSVLDICYYNRLVNYFFGAPNDVFYPSYPIAVNDFSDRVDEAIKYYVEELGKTTVIYDKFLSCLPAITKPNLAKVFTLPDININRNNGWTILMSRIDIYLMVLGLASNQRNNNDIQAVKNKLSYLIREMTSDQGLGGQRIPYSLLIKVNRLKMQLN